MRFERLERAVEPRRRLLESRGPLLRRARRVVLLFELRAALAIPARLLASEVERIALGFLRFAAEPFELTAVLVLLHRLAPPFLRFARLLPLAQEPRRGGRGRLLRDRARSLRLSLFLLAAALLGRVLARLARRPLDCLRGFEQGLGAIVAQAVALLRELVLERVDLGVETPVGRLHQRVPERSSALCDLLGRTRIVTARRVVAREPAHDRRCEERQRQAERRGGGRRERPLPGAIRRSRDRRRRPVLVEVLGRFLDLQTLERPDVARARERARRREAVLAPHRDVERHRRRDSRLRAASNSSARGTRAPRPLRPRQRRRAAAPPSRAPRPSAARPAPRPLRCRAACRARSDGSAAFALGRLPQRPMPEGTPEPLESPRRHSRRSTAPKVSPCARALTPNLPRVPGRVSRGWSSTGRTGGSSCRRRAARCRFGRSRRRRRRG